MEHAPTKTYLKQKELQLEEIIWAIDAKWKDVGRSLLKNTQLYRDAQGPETPVFETYHTYLKHGLLPKDNFIGLVAHIALYLKELIEIVQKAEQDNFILLDDHIYNMLYSTGLSENQDSLWSLMSNIPAPETTLEQELEKVNNAFYVSEPARHDAWDDEVDNTQLTRSQIADYLDPIENFFMDVINKQTRPEYPAQWSHTDVVKRDFYLRIAVWTSVLSTLIIIPDLLYGVSMEMQTDGTWFQDQWDITLNLNDAIVGEQYQESVIDDEQDFHANYPDYESKLEEMNHMLYDAGFTTFYDLVGLIDGKNKQFSAHLLQIKTPPRAPTGFYSLPRDVRQRIATHHQHQTSPLAPRLGAVAMRYRR